MDIDAIKKHLFYEIPNLRDIDVNAALDMFLLEHKLLGVQTMDILDTTDYDSTTSSLLLPTNIISVVDVYLNGLKLKRLRREELNVTFDIGYCLGEDGILYFNFDLIPNLALPPARYEPDELKVFAKKTSAALIDYEDKWLIVAIKYCLQKFYKHPLYFNSDLYSISYNEYMTAKRLVGSQNRQSMKMSFMGDAL
jgi:hypothetical protein